MQTRLAPQYQDSPAGLAAEAILRQCVHCGFCTATCPTYLLLGDELDSPRGRIYLIKQVLEGATPTRKTQQHLDRCLTCRSCESTCPSAVQFGHLIDIGRPLVNALVPRPLPQRALRWLLQRGLTSAGFAPLLALGQRLRPLLPAALQAKIPRPQPAGAWPGRAHPRKVLMLAGCVQPGMRPNINHATARVLDAIGVQTVIVPGSGCCGAIKFHLDDPRGGRDEMRANIDAWWPWLEGASATGEVEGILSNASGCGVMLKDYGHLLRDDPAYAAKAARISALTRDISEWLPELVSQLKGRLQPSAERLVFHPPCSLQHGQRLRGGVEQALGALGFEIRVTGHEAHLCCGSAGTYSLLQPELANALRERKLRHVEATFGAQRPDQIVSANIGCISHLQAGTELPVQHWIEVLDQALLH